MVLIEPVRKDDLQAVIRLALENLTERYDDAFFFTMLELAGDTFLVARDERTLDVVGFALATRQTPYEARLIVIAVVRHHQGQQIGQKLLRAVEKRLVAHGILEVTLEVREENVRAIAFYQRAGYEVRAGVPQYYSDGARAIVMRKGL